MTTWIQIDTDHQICAGSYDYPDSDWHGSSDLCREIWLPGFRLTQIIRSVPGVMTTWIQIDTDHQICDERYDYLDSDWHGSLDQICAGSYDYLDSDWHGSLDQICAGRYDYLDSDWHGSSNLCRELCLPGFRLTRIIRSVPGDMTIWIQIDTDHQICAGRYDYLDSEWHGSLDLCREIWLPGFRLTRIIRSDLCREIWLPGFRLTRIIRSVPGDMTTWIQNGMDH